MAQSIQSLIADSVHGVIRDLYPDQYSKLCHVHAVVGANVISVVLNRVYRPVAGLALVDCGGGKLIDMTDNSAFSRPEGGSYHCWIESADPSMLEKEIVDLTFRHNHEYAADNGYEWKLPHPPDFLWGPESKILVKADQGNVPTSFKEGTVWLLETDEGWDWITRHMAENMQAYVTLTAEALKHLQRSLPDDSTLLAPLMPAREEIKDPVPASTPVPA